jgi:bifunctional DNase/RNase
LPPRPFPYDLLRELLSVFAGELERVVINDFDAYGYAEKSTHLQL